jgi:MYXO-CTERM domain-containing protein
VTEGARLVWSVHRSDDGGATWSLVRTEIAYATADPTQTSPDMNQPLDVGAMYAVSLGALDGTETFSFDATPSLAAIGPITPIGGVYGRSLGDDISTPDATYLFGQTLTLIAPADPDGDGQTALCGDCAPDDVTVFTGATESCDGLDDDCDGAVDEGFASDTDGDGTIDCLDACPHDPADDADGDGACADVDPCPEDATDACGDTSADDTGPDDTGPDDTGPDDTDADTDADADADADGDTDSDTDADTDADTGRDTPPGGKAETRSGCACSGAPSPFGAWALGLAALVLMRRRGAC